MADILEPYKAVVVVNSANRTAGTPGNFVVDLSDQIPLPNNFNRMVLINAAIPKSYYTITQFNNVMYLKENEITTQVTIPIGNYDQYTLSNQLNQSLTNASAINATYVTTFTISTGKYTFTTNKTDPTSFEFSGCPLSYNIGFSEQLYNFSAQSLTAPQIVNLQFTSTLLLYCSIIQSKTNLLVQIIPNQANYGVINYQESAPSHVSKPILESSSTSMVFYLQDEYYNEVDMNGVDMQFTIVLYKANEFANKTMHDRRMELIEQQVDQYNPEDAEESKLNTPRSTASEEPLIQRRYSGGHRISRPLKPSKAEIEKSDLSPGLEKPLLLRQSNSDSQRKLLI